MLSLLSSISHLLQSIIVFLRSFKYKTSKKFVFIIRYKNDVSQELFLHIFIVFLVVLEYTCILYDCVIIYIFGDQMEIIMQKIGERLVEFRKRHHYKQAELAKMLNVSQQVISNIERGVTTPDIEQLKSFADIYNISLDQLVGRDFAGENSDDVERQIINYIKQMDDEGKELSLGLVSQVAQHRGSNDGN